jgi:serine/threonine protein kinase
MLACPACRRQLQVHESQSGQSVPCPHCGRLTPVTKGAAATTGEGPTQSSAQTPSATNAYSAAPPGCDAALVDFLAPPQAEGELGRLGNYRILRVLGHGGMGVVYQAEDIKLKRSVAIKAMLPALAASASAAQRFLREAQAMAAVEHDHIVRIYQVDEDRGVPFLAMEFLRGEPLDVRLKRQALLPLVHILQIGREIAQGLAAAHATGLIHRDIKPGNIFLVFSGQWPVASNEQASSPEPLTTDHWPLATARVKIVDFGLARAVAQDSQITQQGAIIGTPAYMAPEQARGETVDSRCDLFSLGVVLYRLCTGEQPFQGNDPVSTLLAVATQQPVAPRQRNGVVPPELSDLVMRLLEKDPAQRIGSAREVVAALQGIEKNLVSPQPTLAVQPTAVPRIIKAAKAVTTSVSKTAPTSPATTRVRTKPLPPRRRSHRPLILIAAAVVLAGGCILTVGIVGVWTLFYNRVPPNPPTGRVPVVEKPPPKTGVEKPPPTKGGPEQTDIASVPPPGAVVLFDGTLDRWVDASGKGPALWKLLPGGAMEAVGGNIQTRQQFDGPFKLHVEFRVPLMPNAKGQGRGNSGVYLQARYEVQILDSFGLNPSKQDCGAIYGVAAPLVNACKAPEVWQSFDIEFEPAQCAGGKKTAPAVVTVHQNGILIHDRVKIPVDNTISGAGGDPCAPGPVMLQYHASAVQFRNVWLLPKPAGFTAVPLPDPPARAARVLILDGQNNHNWRATTPLLKKALEDTVRFSVGVSSLLKGAADVPGTVPTVPFPPDLASYDVVLSNYNGNPWPADFSKELEGRLKDGKLGLVIVHAANNAFASWNEYNLMIGLGWRGSKAGERLYLDDAGKEVRVPAGAGESTGHRFSGTYTITIRDRQHPITRGMPREWLHSNDELYDNMRGPIRNVHLLATAFSKGTGVNEPIMWTVAYGKGRVFHTPMGHDEKAMRCVGFIATLQRGTEWAATGTVTVPLPGNFPTADKTSTAAN